VQPLALTMILIGVGGRFRFAGADREAMEPNLTQDDLGTEAGYGSGAGVSISRIDNGLTRPGPARFAGIARELGLTPSQLEAEAARQTVELVKERGEPLSSAETATGDERRDRVRRIRQEIARRTSPITELGNAFNEAHDRARDHFFISFVKIAGGANGAPQPDPAGLQDDDVANPAGEANYRIRFTAYGVAHLLAGGMGGDAAHTGHS
jgi:transcriptional regulator with XRE-family HTH domain